MSDGASCDSLDGVLAPVDDEADSAPFAHASRAPTATPAALPSLGRLAEWLPRLGPVLWLEHRHAAVTRQAPRPGEPIVLIDHPALLTVAACNKLDAHQTISAEGPREWICFHSSNGGIEAKLFLLPDSDVLAWDEMSSAFCLSPGTSAVDTPPTHTTFLRRALGRFGQRWQARLIEFRRSQQPWLSVLDAQPPLRISLLGIELARGIVRDENAEWISPLHLA